MVVSKQLGAGPELVHCQVILILDEFMNSAVIPVGVGGAGVVQWYKLLARKVACFSTIVLADIPLFL